MALLACQLPLMFKLLKDVSLPSIYAIIEDLRKMSVAKRSLISEVITLIKLLLATNAESERIFSTMRSVKSYLRSSMKEKRLTSLMIICVQR